MIISILNSSEMIRKAENKDVVRIYELLKQIAKLHYNLYPDFFPNDEAKYNINEVSQLVNNEKIEIFVYLENEIVLGYLIGWYENDYFFVDDLCVDEKARGKNIGKKLMVYIDEEVKVNKIRLNVWSKNSSAINFYEKLGFEAFKQVMEKRK
ncbi:GNAT family N-acetyltransferase [Haploplasma axanthum]|uniref:GNAT family N-acetyltransferase n=1 Tax=Haploplasma axanthum TaxID=29552 RepID=UPI00041810D7|nr:GNAT family N-acetyltransferase [Haploplasma axanthum]